MKTIVKKGILSFFLVCLLILISEVRSVVYLDLNSGQKLLRYEVLSIPFSEEIESTEFSEAVVFHELGMPGRNWVTITNSPRFIGFRGPVTYYGTANAQCESAAYLIKNSSMSRGDQKKCIEEILELMRAARFDKLCVNPYVNQLDRSKSD